MRESPPRLKLDDELGPLLKAADHASTVSPARLAAAGVAVKTAVAGKAAASSVAAAIGVSAVLIAGGAAVYRAQQDEAPVARPAIATTTHASPRRAEPIEPPPTPAVVVEPERVAEDPSGAAVSGEESRRADTVAPAAVVSAAPPPAVAKATRTTAAPATTGIGTTTSTSTSTSTSTGTGTGTGTGTSTSTSTSSTATSASSDHSTDTTTEARTTETAAPPPARVAPPASALPAQLDLYDRARAAAANKQPAKALELLDKLLADYPGTPLRADVELTRAEQLVRANRLDDAASAFERLTDDPVHQGRRGELLRTLGDVRRRQNDCVRALEAYDRALATGLPPAEQTRVANGRAACERR